MAAPPLKVLLLLEDLAFGGTQRQAVELARCFDPARVQVSLRILLRGDDFAPLAADWGVDAAWLTRSRRLGPLGLLALWRCLRLERPDVLVLLTALPNIWGRVVARLSELLPGGATPPPLVVGNIRQSGAPRRYHERWLKNFARHHVCNAHALKEQLVRDYGLPPERVSVIHNGVDVARFHPDKAVKSDPPILLSAGRLVPDKDQATLIRAFERIAAVHPSVELHLYGEGALRGELEGRVAALPPDVLRRVRLPGGCSGFESVYPKATLFMLSSLREGLPNVVLEAMASGLPVVSTAVDGVPELVDDGNTGLLVPPGDDAALAEAALYLLRAGPLCRAMGQQARDRAVREFSFENAARAHEKLFKRLLCGEC